MTQQSTRIRHASSADVPSIVTIHMGTFPGFFLTSLGPRFLSLFYAGLVESPLGVLLVADSGSEAVGFVGGTTDEAAFFAWLKDNHRRQFVREAAIASLKNPSAMKRLWRARRRDSEPAGSAQRAALLTLGVDPARKRSGNGTALVEAFATELSRKDIDGFCLTTDAHGNEAVSSFYVRLGLQRVRTYTTVEGRVMNEYASSLPLNHRGGDGD